jgi:hypothetical protein
VKTWGTMDPPKPKRTFQGTLAHLARQPWAFRLELAAIVILGAIVAVVVGNRYGDVWGYLVGIGLLPLVATRFIRRGIGR